MKFFDQGTAAADIRRKLGIAESTFYCWRHKCGGLEPSEARELKQLREENTKLKRLFADLKSGQSDVDGREQKKW